MLAALMFVLGFSTVFIMLGASASWIGSLLRTELARQVEVFGFSFNPITTAAGLVIIAMGLHFLGVFRMFWISREVRYQHEKHPGGLVGAYLIGLAFAFGWTPCIGPVLGTILTIAASEQDVLKGASLLAVYSAGLGIPFMLAAAGVGTFMGFMSGFRKHLKTVERVAGALLVALRPHVHHRRRAGGVLLADRAVPLPAQSRLRVMGWPCGVAFAARSQASTRAWRSGSVIRPLAFTSVSSAASQLS